MCFQCFFIPLHTLIEVRKVKVLFDHQIFCFRYGGASKYFAMLLNALPNSTWDTTSIMAMNEYVRSKHLFPSYKTYFKGQALLSDYLNRPYTNYRLAKGDYDVFHQTNFGTYCLKSLGNKPMVTTYHDSNMSTYDAHPEIVERQRASLARADAVICVSHNTKSDMLNLFDLDEHKVHVVYHGIEIPDMSVLNPQRLFDYPYILYVGRRSAYKNFARLARAFAVIHEKYPEIHLVCTSQSFSNDELMLFRQLRIISVVHSIAADELTMQRLYRDALLFVFPSLYEGFGMPILEAWSCNCPVVLSDASCFPEIAGDAASYFKADDIDDMVKSILNVVNSDELMRTLVERGCARVRQFSWETTAEKHLRLYETLI